MRGIKKPQVGALAFLQRFGSALQLTGLNHQIGELQPGLQAKLLRVLQEREYERVGGTRTLTANVRLLAATNRDLEAAVTAGTFRQDLYYRIKVVPLRLPPLRERSADMARFARDAGRPAPAIEAAALRVLQDYSWPGNIRELSNVIERCIVLGAGDVVTVDDLPEELQEHAAGSPGAAEAGPDAGYHTAVAAAKRAILREALASESGHQTRAAKRLGLTQPYLARLLKNLRQG